SAANAPSSLPFVNRPSSSVSERLALASALISSRMCRTTTPVCVAAMTLLLTGFAGLLYFTRAATPAGRDIFFSAGRNARRAGGVNPLRGCQRLARYAPQGVYTPRPPGISAEQNHAPAPRLLLQGEREVHRRGPRAQVERGPRTRVAVRLPVRQRERGPANQVHLFDVGRQGRHGDLLGHEIGVKAVNLARGVYQQVGLAGGHDEAETPVLGARDRPGGSGPLGELEPLGPEVHARPGKGRARSPLPGLAPHQHPAP